MWTVNLPLELSQFHTPKIHRITISTNSKKRKTIVTIKETRKKYISEIYQTVIDHGECECILYLFPKQSPGLIIKI